MKKFLTFSTLAILFFLFGCEEEQALRLHTAPEYYQGRAMLPTGKQIEMTEEDRSTVLEACAPEDTVTKVPDGERRWLGTVTLTRPLTATAGTPPFPTATFFSVEDQPFVRCHVDSITYVKGLQTVPQSILKSNSASLLYPDSVKLDVAEGNERAQFSKDLTKSKSIERESVEQTLVHVTLPFSGQLELTFASPDQEETVTIPIDLPMRATSLSLGLGMEKVEKEMRYAIFTSLNEKNYKHALQPANASVSRLLGAEMLIDSSTTLEPGARQPLFSFSFVRDDKSHQHHVSITYKESDLLSGDRLKRDMKQQFTHRRHAVFHDMALIGTESADAPFLKHTTQEEMDFVFTAIERANSTSHAGTPASTPHLTLFEGVRAQTFDISYDKRNVFLTSNTGSHFKLLREDADQWHKFFEDQ